MGRSGAAVSLRCWLLGDLKSQLKEAIDKGGQRCVRVGGLFLHSSMGVSEKAEPNQAVLRR